jgi:magnesium transporter
MIGPLLQADFEEIIAAKDWNTLRETLIELPPPDIAELISEVPVADQGVIFRVLPREMAAVVFEYLPRRVQRDLVQSLSDEQVHSILNEMTPDDRTRLLEELPAEVTRRLLDELAPDALQKARKLLGYPEGTAGRYMTPEYVALQPDITAGEAMERIRKTGRGKETLAVIYIINEKGKLLEDLRLGSLVLADPQTMIGDIEDRPVVAIPATMHGEDIVEQFERYDRTALPVVDNNGFMLGIVTHDDVLEFAERRATKEMQQLGGSEAFDKPYLSVGFWEMVHKRGVWLAVLFLGEMLTATAMGYFEGEIEKAAVVALFVPLIISSGGNSGSQGTSLIIRSLALKELNIRDWRRVFVRELRTGLALGLFLGLIGFCRISVWQGLSHAPTVGAFFQTHGSREEQRVPDGMKQINTDFALNAPITLPSITLQAGQHLSKGMLVPADFGLPAGVPTLVSTHEHATAYGRHWFLIGLTVFVALIGVVTWGSLSGSMLPFVLRALGVDPATSSAPFVATLVDVTGLIIYFLVAKIVLTGTLL